MTQGIIVPPSLDRGGGGGGVVPGSPGGGAPRDVGGGGSIAPDAGASDDLLTPGGLAARKGLPLGLVPYTFGIGSLAINQTNLQLYRIVPHSAHVGAQLSVRPPYGGSVVGLCVMCSASKTAGACTFTVYKNAVAQAATLTLGNVTHQEQTFPTGTYSFAALDALDVRATTDGTYAPTTLNIEVLLYLQQAAS